MPLLSTERLYTGRIVNLDLDTVRFPDGSTGRLEMLRHPGASAVVPLLDPVDHPDPRVVLIRQFRHAAEDFIWEVPAGRLDAGETPEFKRHARDFAAALKAKVRHPALLVEGKNQNHFELALTLGRADGLLGKIALEQMFGR